MPIFPWTWYDPWVDTLFHPYLVGFVFFRDLQPTSGWLLSHPNCYFKEQRLCFYSCLQSGYITLPAREIPPQQTTQRIMIPSLRHIIRDFNHPPLQDFGSANLPAIVRNQYLDEHPLWESHRDNRARRGFSL